MSSFSDYVQTLADESKRLAMAELRRLSGLDRARAAEFSQVWSSFPVERRRQIVKSLVEIVEDNVDLDFSAVLKICLFDPDEQIRTAAIEGLWEDEESSTALRFLDLLEKDPSEQVRAAAAAGLAPFVYRAEMGELSGSTADKLRRGLDAAVARREESANVRRRAVEALAYLSSPDIQRLIEETYADSDPKMRASAVFAMGRSCDTAWLDTIVLELSSPSAEMRYEAARAAGELEDERAVRPLVPLLIDADREVRLAAIAALGEIGGAVAKRALEYTLKNGDDEARTAAADALEELTFDEDPLGVQPRISGDKLN